MTSQPFPSDDAAPAAERPRARNPKLRVLFVGAFAAKAPDGAVGGVMTATRALIASPLSDHVDWIPIDTTGASVPPPPVGVRLRRAVARSVRFVGVLLMRRIDVAYIPASHGTSFLEKGVMVLLARMRGIPVALHPISGLIPDDLARSRFMRWYIPFVLRRCALILCQGASWQRFYTGILGGEERTAVLGNWIEIDPLVRAADAEASRSDPAPSGRAVRILYMGWIERFKGIFDLIDAARAARERLGPVQFVVCGKGSDFDAARRHARDAGVADLFEFRGWATGAAKNQVLAEVDLYVHPSHREGMPNALLEAMAAGLPAIAARAGGVPDVLSNPDAGILFEPGDVPALAEALVALVRDPERRIAMGRAARRHVVEHHGIDAVWPRMLALLTRAAGARRGRPPQEQIA